MQVVELEVEAGFQREASGEQHPAVHHGQEQRRLGDIGVHRAELGGDAGDGGVDGRAVMDHARIAQGIGQQGAGHSEVSGDERGRAKRGLDGGAAGIGEQPLPAERAAAHQAGLQHQLR